MTKIEAIPDYVYPKKFVGSSLSQGDVLRVDGQFRDYFVQFYPEINHPEDESKYVMILTQSYDLVKTKKRKPKLSHVNVCLVRSLKAVVDRLLTEEIKPSRIDEKNILQKADLDKLKDRLSKLLNNTDQKTHFFLPRKNLLKKIWLRCYLCRFHFAQITMIYFYKVRYWNLNRSFKQK